MTTVILLLAPTSTPVEITATLGERIVLRLPCDDSGAWWTLYDVDPHFLGIPDYGHTDLTSPTKRWVARAEGVTRFRAIYARGNDRPRADLRFEVTIQERD